MSLFSYEQLHSTLNHRKTKALFAETCNPDQEPIMTLGRNEKKGLVVLRDYFIDLVATDPSEYTFAETVFGDYAFWDNLSQATWIQPYLAEWRMVADVKRKSLAFSQLLTEVQSQGRNAYGAAKYLVEEPWKKGRPAKKVSKETSTKAAEGFSDDVARLRDYMNE